MVAVVMAWCVSAVAATTFGADTPPAGSMLEEVLVTGERPGPGMWRVATSESLVAGGCRRS